MKFLLRYISFGREPSRLFNKCLLAQRVCLSSKGKRVELYGPQACRKGLIHRRNAIPERTWIHECRFMLFAFIHMHTARMQTRMMSNFDTHRSIRTPRTITRCSDVNCIRCPFENKQLFMFSHSETASETLRVRFQLKPCLCEHARCCPNMRL